MDEQDKQESGDSSDDLAEGIKKIADAAKQFGKSGEENNNETIGEDPASKNGGNSTDALESNNDGSNSDTHDSKGFGSGANSPEPKGTNTGSNMPAKRNTNIDSNPPALKSPDTNAVNPAAQQGAEAGANQVAQQSANAGAAGGAGATAAQKGVELGAEAAAKSAEVTANAAAATVKAGMETGQAVAGIASGTAVGGPWGAVITAAWSMKNTLFKILVCICLLYLISMVVSLPSVVFNHIFQIDPDSIDASEFMTVYNRFEDLAAAIAECVTIGYDYAMDEIEVIVNGGNYDYDFSMGAIVDYGAISVDYDICYILAAYSVSMEQRGATKQDMVDKLLSLKEKMFNVTFEIKRTTIMIQPEEEYLLATPKIITYAACVLHSFDKSIILDAFDIDETAIYNQFDITYGEAIEKMADSFKLTIYGYIGRGIIPPLEDAEILEFLENLECSPQRKELITAALSLVGRVPYFWGGKSASGWNDEWNTPKLVTSTGSSTSNTLQPYGLDCTGFTDWVYKTALGINIGEGSYTQWDNSIALTKSELLPGDLGYMAVPGTVNTNHVLIYAGKDPNGNILWVHCEFNKGVHINSPDYVKYYRRPKGVDWED